MVELCFTQMCADPRHVFYLFRFSAVRTDPEQSWLRLDNDQFVLIGQWKLMVLLLFPASGFIQQSHWNTSMYFKSLSVFLNWVWLFFRANIDLFPPNQLSIAHLWQSMSLLKQEMNTLMCKYSQSKLIWVNTAGWHFVLQPNGCWQWLGGNPFCKLHGENISKSWGAEGTRGALHTTRSKIWHLASSTQRSSGEKEAMGYTYRGKRVLDGCHTQINLSCKLEGFIFSVLACACTLGRQKPPGCPCLYSWDKDWKPGANPNGQAKKLSSLCVKLLSRRYHPCSYNESVK